MASLSEGSIDFLAGTVGGFAGKLVDYPFDTVKVLLQTQNVGTSAESAAAAQPRYTGAIDCLVKTVRSKGFLGLYKGLASPLIGSMAENAVLFAAYGQFQAMLRGKEKRELSLFDMALAGAGAGAVVSFVLTPVELIKCRLQVQQSVSKEFRAYAGPIDCIVKTVKQEGIAGGLYKGNTSMLLREIPGNFAWYGVYEGVCAHYVPEGGTKDDLSPMVNMGAGAASGVAYWTAFYPADTVKSQIQTNPEFAQQSILGTFNTIYRRSGISGLYSGWGITVARAAPAHGIIFLCYEQVSKALRARGGGEQ
eukprot:g1568.t1